MTGVKVGLRADGGGVIARKCLILASDYTDNMRRREVW